ncbi:MAG: hypothetical protein ACR2FF_09210 [Mycobacteriales bacterium]
MRVCRTHATTRNRPRRRGGRRGRGRLRIGQLAIRRSIAGNADIAFRGDIDIDIDIVE